MTSTYNYRRPAFVNRPWIRGQLYDLLSRSTVLHCDAYVHLFAHREFLILDWREGGSKPIALDAWRVDTDGLTPVWDRSVQGIPMYSRDPTLHARVVAEVRRTQAAGPWLRVSLLCHYIDVRETNVEAPLTMRAPQTRRQKYTSKLPDIL